MSLLAGLQSKKLKPTTTRVRLQDGRIFEEVRSAGGGFQSQFNGHEAVPSYLKKAPDAPSPLVPKAFEPKSGKWVDGVPDAKTGPLALTAGASLSFVTFNVWFKDWFLASRAAALFEIVAKLSPDVVCLQEVTDPFLRLLLAERWVQQGYWVSDSTGSSVYPYGVLMLVSRRLPLPALALHWLPSNMGRRLLTALFPVAGPAGGAAGGAGGSAGAGQSADRKDAGPAGARTLAVGTVHLESMDNTELRIEQLKTILPLLSKAPNEHALLMGDFNFGDGHEEGQTLQEDKAWTDVWKSLRPSESGNSGADGVMGRFDRVLLRSGLLRAASVAQLGTEKIAAARLQDPKAKDLRAGQAVYPSDHYGVHAIVSVPK